MSLILLEITRPSGWNPINKCVLGFFYIILRHKFPWTGKMDQQGKGSHFLFKRHQLQNKTFDARPEDYDASFKSRLVSLTHSIISPTYADNCCICWEEIKGFVNFTTLLTSFFFCLSDTKMDRKDKLFVVNEVGLLNLFNLNVTHNSYIIICTVA